MVEKIQLAEAKAWNEYERAVQVFGKDNEITNKRRAVWAAIDDLRESIGIERMKMVKLKELNLL